MVSLVLAIGVTHLLQGVVTVVRYRETLAPDWVPVAWAASLFLTSALYWWSLWDFRTAQWTFPTFLFVLLAPTLLYVAISLLVSADVTTAADSHTANFERIRVPFMTVMLVFTSVWSVDGWLLGVEPAWIGPRIPQIGVAVTLLVGALSPRRMIQQVVAGTYLAAMVGGGIFVRYQPGVFGLP